ncbi:pseudouridine synthase [Ciceribacter sp. L1K23]|uniref:pseudouridine synthase n=1 Tax=Ciceribacter sp. L1K23 TaxID=2820276 RepID=UPI001B830C01|nr:pseudouridine synthase [Ciceribacter sp. L1K23]MBR0556817.1 pseudouridine synthase [Ciceribacter sp. L1K23]
MTSKDKPRKSATGPSGRGGKDATRKPAPDKAKRSPKPTAMAAAATPAADEAKPERISKLLARAGVASRRDIERMIMDGRVRVNGKVLDTPVLNATFADRIEVDGQPIQGIERTRLWLYHKPAGLVTTNSDPEGRPTVFENLPEDLPRVMSIGRLDINTEGLLLLTNDGGLARVLELPTTGWLRRYRVRAHGEIDQAALDALKDGIAVDGVLYGSIDATLDRSQGRNVWLTMGLREGKNREIKNVLGALGLDVNRLIRISYGPFQLGDLGEGKVVEVRGRMLRDQLGPRLIEEAKANFEAPLHDRKAVDAEDETEKPAKRAKPAREWGRDDREAARDRLDTRKPEGPRGDRKAKSEGFRRDDRDQGRGGVGDRPKRTPAMKSRTSNVWMAPGARPVAEKKAGDESASAKAPRREAAGPGKRYGRDKDGKPTKGMTRFDPDRKSFDDRGRRDEGPRVQVSRARDEDGEWIRAESPASNPRGGDDGKRGFGERGPRRDFGDRPERGDRPKFDRGERSGAPRGDRPTFDRGDRPAGDRADRPRGAKPFGDKPKGGKSFGGKPAGKSFGGKPGGKPSAGRPGGKGPGGKPSGGGRGPGRGQR